MTIAVDSFGPVTDNAQSVYELSRIEALPDISAEIEKDFGFKPNFHDAKLELEKGDGAGNTFKATAKPVLIGTAVVGATTMIFGIIMLLQNVSGHAIENLSLVQPQIIFGLLMGGAVIYWFTGASMQAVVTGAYSAVVFIKKNLKLDKETASLADSKKVVEICTVYAQRGLINIFVVVFAFALGLPFFNPYFFIGYLIGIAFFGLFQAIFMANAGGAWDNAKKIVEVDLKQKGTPLHAATVVGDTVGDPFKDTSSVAMNPIIKFTTLFGLLAVEIAVKLKQEHPDSCLSYVIGSVCFLVALVFVYRSFYCMRIPRISGESEWIHRATDRDENGRCAQEHFPITSKFVSNIQLLAGRQKLRLEKLRPKFQIGICVCHRTLHPGRLATARLFYRRCFCPGQSRLEKCPGRHGHAQSSGGARPIGRRRPTGAFATD